MAQFILLDTQPSIHTSRTACGLSEFPLGMASTSTSLLSIQSQSMTTSLCGKFSFLSQYDIIHQSSASGRHQAHAVFCTQSCIQSSIDKYWEAVISLLLVVCLSLEISDTEFTSNTKQWATKDTLFNPFVPPAEILNFLWKFSLGTNLKKCLKLVKPFGWKVNFSNHTIFIYFYIFWHMGLLRLLVFKYTPIIFEEKAVVCAQSLNIAW